MKSMFKLAFIFCACLGLAHAATPEEAMKGLGAACPGLKVYTADLKIEMPAKGAASLDAQRDRKWREAYTVAVRVSDKATGKLMSDYKAQGQSCYFEVEAVNAREVSIAKSACQSVCKDKPYALKGVGYFSVDGAEEFKR